MKNLDLIWQKNFLIKYVVRFPSVTIGNIDGEVTNVPKRRPITLTLITKKRNESLGKVSVSVTDESS